MASSDSRKIIYGGVMMFRYLFIAMLTALAYTNAMAGQLNIPGMDEPSRIILTAPLASWNTGISPGGADANMVIHRNFPQIIEQNFARYGLMKATALVDNMSERELSDLATLYTAAVNDLGRPPQLLNVLALRLDATHLARLSNHFGFLPTYAAISAYAPAKRGDFERLASTRTAAPAGRVVPDVGGGIGQFMTMTPYEIYLDFRTAPVGSLGVVGSLYETGVAMANGTGIAYAAGYAAGTAAAKLIQTYDPSLYTTIGGTVAQMVTNVQNAATQFVEGKYEASAGTLFGLDYTVRHDQLSFGGDWNVSNAWATDDSEGCGFSVPSSPEPEKVVPHWPPC